MVRLIISAHSDATPHDPGFFENLKNLHETQYQIYKAFRENEMNHKSLFLLVLRLLYPYRM